VNWQRESGVSPLAIAAVGILALLWRIAYAWQIGQEPLHTMMAEQAVGPMADLWRRWGISCTALSGIQLVFGVANCLLVWKLATALLGNGVGFMAGLMSAFYGPFIYMEFQIDPGPWDAFVLLLGLVSLVAWRVHPSISGFLLGLAGALSGPAFLLIAVAGWWVGRKEVRDAVRLLGGWLLGMLLVLQWTTEWGVLQLVPVAAWPSALARFFWGGEWSDFADPYLAVEGTVIEALLWHWGLFFPLGLIGPLVLLGLLDLWRHSLGTEGYFVLAVSLVAVLGTALHGGDPLLRTGIMPVLLLAAAQGVASLKRSWQPDRRAMLLWIFLALLVVVWNRGDHIGQERGTVYERQMRARAYEGLAMNANAVREYEAAIAFDSAPAQAYVGLARLYGKMGDYRRASRIYEQIEAKDADLLDLQMRAEQANAYMLADMPREAARKYEALVTKDPAGDRWLGVTGDARLLMGDIEGALVAYRDALASDPDSTRVRYSLARLCASVGRIDEALEAYELLRTHPDWRVEAGWRSAALLVERGEKATAEAALNTVLAIEADHVPALWELGKLLAVEERFEEALSIFERLRDLEPGGFRAHFFLGKLYFRVGRTEEAEISRRLFETRKRRAEVQQAMEDDLNAVLRQFGE